MVNNNKQNNPTGEKSQIVVFGNNKKQIWTKKDIFVLAAEDGVKYDTYKRNNNTNKNIGGTTSWH